MEYKVNLTEEAINYILSLPNKMQAKIHRTINLLKELGYLLPQPHSKKIKGNKELYELRIKCGSDISRMFYFFWKENIYFITSGYTKKTKKLDKKEIKKAEEIMKNIKEG